MYPFLLHFYMTQSNASAMRAQPCATQCYAPLARCIQTHQRHRNGIGIVPSTSVRNNNERSKGIRVVLSTVVKETGAHVRAFGKEGRNDELLCC